LSFSDLHTFIDWLKSQSFAILSHSVPGSMSSVSAIFSFSAFLKKGHHNFNILTVHTEISFSLS